MRVLFEEIFAPVHETGGIALNSATTEQVKVDFL
jgi:hypothetical protein